MSDYEADCSLTYKHLFYVKMINNGSCREAYFLTTVALPLNVQCQSTTLQTADFLFLICGSTQPTPNGGDRVIRATYPRKNNF